MTRPPQAESDFYANLAEDMPEPELKALATQFLDLIGTGQGGAQEARRAVRGGPAPHWLGDDAPGGAQFKGASRSCTR
jgi:hypothetical protein